MKTLKLDQIVIPENRFRREFDEKKLNELKQSILRNGLFNPVTVEFVNEQWLLRAGERRLRVLQQIAAEGTAIRLGGTTFAVGEIPVVSFDELTPIQRLEIEIEENVVRADFTWQERDASYAALHKLRKEQNPAQSVKDTADEILGHPTVGYQRQPVADALITAKFMHVPEVAKAKSTKEALKVIRKLTEVSHRAKLAKAAIGIKVDHRLLLGNAIEHLRQLPAAEFDVVLSDPPYGIGAEGFGDMASVGHDYSDSYKYWKEIMSELPDELARVTKPRAHCYLFCDQRRFEELKTLMVLANWEVFPTMLIWDKSPTGMLPFPDYGPRRTYETILYAWKGDRKVLMVKPDVISLPAIKLLKHGAQKPVSLYLELLSRSANPGDVVLDCFGGTGPILVAANRMKLKATYIEQNQDFFNIAQLRASTSEIDDGAEEPDGLEDIEI